MSQGISSAFSFLVNRLEALIPKTDESQGFVCVDPASGMELLTDRRPNTLRVCYDIPRDVGLLERIVGEDSSQLVNSLRDPAYSLATTGITSLITGEATTTPLLDEAGNPAALLLIVPFDLL